MTDRRDLEVRPRRGLFAGLLALLWALVWFVVKFVVKHWPWTLTVLAAGWLVHTAGASGVKVGLYVVTAVCLVGVAAICVHEQRGYLRIRREAAVEAEAPEAVPEVVAGVVPLPLPASATEAPIAAAAPTELIVLTDHGDGVLRAAANE